MPAAARCNAVAGASSAWTGYSVAPRAQCLRPCRRPAGRRRGLRWSCVGRRCGEAGWAPYARIGWWASTILVLALHETPRRERDARRNSSLWCGGAAADGELPRVLRGFRVPPMPVRVAQRVAMKLGWLDWDRLWLEPLVRARRSVLGPRADGPPRLLVRVDEFPNYSAFDRPEHGNDASRRFNDVMAASGVHHLMALNTQLTHAALDPAAEGGRRLGDQEMAVIEEMRASGLVTFAQHGTTHRTRFADPRRQSEYVGLDGPTLAAVVDRGRGALREIGIEPRVLVAPFNRFSAGQWRVLSERFDVICGGPESVALIGLQGGPLWHGDAVYLPCYAPLYARARDVVQRSSGSSSVHRVRGYRSRCHSMWELDDGFRSLARLADLVAPHAARGRNSGGGRSVGCGGRGVRALLVDEGSTGRR